MASMVSGGVFLGGFNGSKLQNDVEFHVQSELVCGSYYSWWFMVVNGTNHGDMVVNMVVSMVANDGGENGGSLGSTRVDGG